ncbi:MAG: DUF2946 family protein [Pseudolabrys sp.]|jgi:hypothetical protein
MRGLARQVAGWVAIYAVALHVILLGLVPTAANGEIVNPVSVICHSVAPAGDEAPGKPDLVPGHACEHCNLCSAAAPPEPAVVLMGNLLPTRLLRVLRPASHAPTAGIVFSPHLARGPPRFA